MRRNRPFPLGSVSSGTMRTEDLLPDFADTLRGLAGSRPDKAERTLLRECRQWINDMANAPEEPSAELYDTGDELVSELFDAIDAHCPAYVTFGAHEGDGADYGFWPEIDALEESVQDGDVQKVNDLSELPKGYRGDVMLVSDHGNVTFGYVNSRGFREVWSTV